MADFEFYRGLFGERDPRERISELIKAGNVLVEEKRYWKRKYEQALEEIEYMENEVE